MPFAFDSAVSKGAEVLLRDLEGDRYQYMARLGNKLIPGEVHHKNKENERFFSNGDTIAAAETEITGETELTSVNSAAASGELITYASAAETSVNMDERTLVTTLTTAGLDRGGTIILSKGIALQDYRKNPVVLWSHMSWMLPLGVNMWVKPEGDKALIGKTRFAQRPASHAGEWLPDTVLDLYNQKVLRGVSIGVRADKTLYAMDGGEETQKEFKEHKEWKGAWRVILNSLMLEYSCCSIPMNPDALSRAYSDGLKIPTPVMRALGIPDPEQAKALAKLEQAVDTPLQSVSSPSPIVATSAQSAPVLVTMTADDVYSAARALGASGEIARAITQALDLNTAVREGIDKARGRV